MSLSSIAIAEPRLFVNVLRFTSTPVGLVARPPICTLKASTVSLAFRSNPRRLFEANVFRITMASHVVDCSRRSTDSPVPPFELKVLSVIRPTSKFEGAFVGTLPGSSDCWKNDRPCWALPTIVLKVIALPTKPRFVRFV